MFILFALLPLAANAVCNSRTLADCSKCGVGVISQKFSYSVPCDCNDNAGRFGQTCPKTGVPHYPVCCSVDGKVATKQSRCKCGTGTCNQGQLCTASTNTCAYPVCANTDGSKRLTQDQCSCGASGCYTGAFCTVGDAQPCKNEVCSTVDGSAVATNIKPRESCQCGDRSCYHVGDTCDASTSTCKPSSTTTTAAPVTTTCKYDVVLTDICKCGYSGARVGQICPAKDDAKNPKIRKDRPHWPACVGSDMFATLNQNCLCAEKTHCGYGQKCTQTGDFKGMCECVPGDNIGCIEVVPPTDKCPKTCDGHTTMDADAIVLNECITSGFANFKITTNPLTYSFYTDAKCTTKTTAEALGLTPPKMMTPGCQEGGGEDGTGSIFVSLPASATGSGTALKVTMPALFVVGLLAFVLL